MDSFFYVIFVISCISLSYVVYRFLLKRSNKYILKKANVGGIRWGLQTKPIVGGLGFFSIFLFATLFFMFSHGLNFTEDYQLFGVIMVVTISFMMGLADDIMNTPPFFKFFVQLLSAAVLIYFGFIIDVSPVKAINYTITVFWVVGIMNSINMLDNMDSIAGPISLVIFTGSVFIMLLSGQHIHNFFMLIAIAMVIVLLVFLFHNWPPARMYMGDNGSQILGALLAIFGIIFFWNTNSDSCYCYNSKQFIAVLLAFIIPITDTTTVTINRLRRGKSPFVGGKDHTTHHLNYFGFSPRMVSSILIGITLFSTSLSVYITCFLKKWELVHFLVFGIFCLLVFISLFSLTYISKPPQRAEN